jgi:hypothetical protein
MGGIDQLLGDKTADVAVTADDDDFHADSTPAELKPDLMKPFSLKKHFIIL